MGLLMFSIAIVAMNYPVILTIIAPSPPPKLSANQKQEFKKMTNQVPDFQRFLLARPESRGRMPHAWHAGAGCVLRV